MASGACATCGNAWEECECGDLRKASEIPQPAKRYPSFEETASLAKAVIDRLKAD